MSLGKINNLILSLCKPNFVATSKSQSSYTNNIFRLLGLMRSALFFAYACIKKESGIDVFVEKVNRKIAHVLGKKQHSNKPENKSTSNKVFIAIIIIVLLLLWESTGFYYLSENQTGIVLTNGKITQIINGMKVGFVYPYPFSDIEIVDTGVTDFVKISKNDTQDYYTTLSRDLLPVSISAKFSYQVVNPRLLFLNILQKNDNLDDVVKFTIWQNLHSYIANNSQKEIATKNLTVMSSEIKTSINQSLANLGLNLVKLQIDAVNYSDDNSTNIKTLDKTNIAESVITALPNVAIQLINEANRYKTDKISETQLNINKFNQLLPQYQKNPDSIAMQMYYEMLEKVPVKKDDYLLLNSKLSELLLKTPDNINIAAKPADTRGFDRNVDRDRDLNGH